MWTTQIQLGHLSRIGIQDFSTKVLSTADIPAFSDFYLTKVLKNISSKFRMSFIITIFSIAMLHQLPSRDGTSYCALYLSAFVNLSRRNKIKTLPLYQWNCKRRSRTLKNLEILEILINRFSLYTLQFPCCLGWLLLLWFFYSMLILIMNDMNNPFWRESSILNTIALLCWLMSLMGSRSIYHLMQIRNRLFLHKWQVGTSHPNLLLRCFVGDQF